MCQPTCSHVHTARNVFMMLKQNYKTQDYTTVSFTQLILFKLGDSKTKAIVF